MKRTRFTDEQIAGILHETAGAGTVREVCRKHGITETTFYRWRAKYGGMQKAEIRRLKQRIAYPVSNRWACRLVQFARSRWQYRPHRPVAAAANAQWTLDFFTDAFTSGRKFRVLRRGVPQRLIIDNGPEFVAKTLDAWAYARGVELSSTRPGKPVDNCFVESFHDKFRDECQSTYWFRDLPEALTYWHCES